MGAVKFEGVDVLDFLGKVVELHTQHYKDDFDIDKELIQNLAACRNEENEQLLWMSRTCGTYCLWERDVYLQDSHENKVWRFYHEQTKDSILAYAIQLDGIQDGKVTGCIWPLDYHAHVERVKLLSCAIEKVSVLFQDGTQVSFPHDSYMQQINMFKAEHGTSKCVTWLPESEQELQTILRREHVKRDYHAKPGDIQEYMDSLKKSTLRGKLKEVQAAAAFTRKPPSHKKEPER